MQESAKTGADNEIPTGQKVNTKLHNKLEKVAQLQKNQSIEPEN